MIVEDDPLTADWLVGVVRSRGFEAEGPYDSEIVAMGSAAFERPNAAILDLDLGGPNSHHKTSVRVMTMLADLRVPFLVYTAHPEIGRLSRNAWRAPVVAKPADADRIWAALHGVMTLDEGVG